MDLLLDIIIVGLSIGIVHGLVALGISLIFPGLDIGHFAHGQRGDCEHAKCCIGKREVFIFACRSPSYSVVTNSLKSSRRDTACSVIDCLRVGSQALS